MLINILKQFLVKSKIQSIYLMNIYLLTYLLRNIFIKKSIN